MWAYCVLELARACNDGTRNSKLATKQLTINDNIYFLIFTLLQDVCKVCDPLVGSLSMLGPNH